MSDLINDPNLISAMQELGRGLKSPSDLAQLSRELLKITVEASLNAEMDAHVTIKGLNSRRGRRSHRIPSFSGVSKNA